MNPAAVPLASVLLGAALCAAAQPTAPAETEQRNAAALHVLAQAATLGMVRDECRRLASGGPDAVEAVVRQWRERNAQDLETAAAWAEHHLREQKAAGAARHAEASRRFVGGVADTVQRAAAELFRRQAPTAQTCDAALQPWKGPERDLPSRARTPATEAHAQALAGMRAAAGLGANATLGPELERGLSFGRVASAHAARAAMERGDGAAASALYLDMANDGDAAAAQTLAVMYLEGKVMPRNPLQAYRWFYIAWTLGDQEGLNGLGVLQRDGLVGVPNPRLAYGAFMVAAERARDAQGRARALRNAQRLEAQLPVTERVAIGCMSLDAFDRELVKPVAATQPVRGRVLAQADRPLRAIAPRIMPSPTFVCG